MDVDGVFVQLLKWC